MTAALPELRTALKDASSDVRIAAAQALAEYGGASEAPSALAELAKDAAWGPNDVFTSMGALAALDTLDPAAVKPILANMMASLPSTGPEPDQRYSSYVPSLLEHLAARLGLPNPVPKKEAKGAGEK